MDNEAVFLSRLTGFGLSEKEAQLYLHLLKYGPKTPSPLAKSLHTYREDVHRTLTSLIEKGMVRPSLDSPTVYAAVDLDTALGSALQKQESELREMETRKRELQELSKQQRFRPSDEVSTFKIIKSIKELIAVMLPVINSLHEDWTMLLPAVAAVIGAQFGVDEAAYEFVKRGGRVRMMINISYPIAKITQGYLDNGIEVRHFGQEGINFTIFDKRICISAISADVTRISPNESIAALWTDDPTYARYLLSTFETLWKQSIPAAERIEELIKAGPPQAGTAEHQRS
ncbi:MAG: helix-turn-helix domain-containing protein [Halobacteriota archaeon]|jgi:sugar-specific transcriptional regulator TrmB